MDIFRTGEGGREGAQLHSIAFRGDFTENLFWMMKIAQMSEFTPQKLSLTTKVDEFLLSRIGCPKNGYIKHAVVSSKKKYLTIKFLL